MKSPRPSLIFFIMVISSRN
ncbi:hypothetical protein Pint_20427 [Pistacia integerrima]|uniref:Uncharacterized protein n=1 Tax=Pistacia integerrima TaxID=434235 RepID=A0ACC0XDG1_9ROSI|nr:hypothetical protein Pint_20427 [Pistacia integerrima]